MTTYSIPTLEENIIFNREPVEGFINIRATETSMTRLGYALRELEEFEVQAKVVEENVYGLLRQDPRRGALVSKIIMSEINMNKQRYAMIASMERYANNEWHKDTSAINPAKGKAKKEFPTVPEEALPALGIPKHVFMALLVSGKQICVVGDAFKAGNWIENGIDKAEEYISEQS